MFIGLSSRFAIFEGFKDSGAFDFCIFVVLIAFCYLLPLVPRHDFCILMLTIE